MFSAILYVFCDIMSCFMLTAASSMLFLTLYVLIADCGEYYGKIIKNSRIFISCLIRPVFASFDSDAARLNKTSALWRL